MTTDISNSAKTIVTSICPTCGCSLMMGNIFFADGPYCLFRKDPDHYVKRLQGEIPYTGVFGEAGCCSTET